MIGSGSGIGNVIVDKGNLIMVLLQNQHSHREVYEKATVIFREKATRALEDLIEKVQSGEHVSLVVPMLVPEDHTADYERAIRMLQMHTEDTIQLSEEAYARLVDDEWEWTQRWFQNTLSYTNQGQ